MSEPKVLTPENLTWEDLKAMDGPTMRKGMGSIMAPGLLREAIYKLTQQHAEQQVLESQPQVPQPTPEEQAAAEQAQLEAERQRAEAETQRLAAEEAAKNKKIVLEYQVSDEEGKPIGRPTHLEATTHEELIEKMKEAHTQATRAFHRLKKQKVQSLREINSQPAAPVVQQMTDGEMLQAIKDLKSDDPTKALEAHKKLTKAESDRIQAEADAKVAVAQEKSRAEQVSYAFLKAHTHDFNNCEANVKMLTAYFQENDIPWTLPNLEIAFHALESELAPVAVSVVPTPPVNPAPAKAPVAATPAAAAAAQPTPTVTAQVTPPANPAPAQPRPGVNGGIVPGQTSAGRPAATPKGITKAEIKSWDAKTMREKMRNPQVRAEIEAALRA